MGGASLAPDKPTALVYVEKPDVPSVANLSRRLRVALLDLPAFPHVAVTGALAAYCGPSRRKLFEFVL